MQHTTPIHLTHWLSANRTHLLPRWIAAGDDLFAPERTLSSGNGGSVPVHPDERKIVLTTLYDGLIAAAGGDEKPLDECLSTLRALRSSIGEDDLPRQIMLFQRLRSMARHDLFQETIETGASPTREETFYHLFDALDDLIDRAITMLVERWVNAAHKVLHELNETRLLVESLYRDAEVTDRTTLQVSRLNQLARELSSTLDDREAHLKQICISLAEVLAPVVVDIWLLKPDSTALELAWRHGAELPDTRDMPLDAQNDLVVQTFTQGETIFTTDIPASLQSDWRIANLAVLTAPLVTQRGIAGIIVCQGDDHTLADRSQQEFVRSVASQAAIALENARLYAEVRAFNVKLEARINERTQELRTLNEIALEVNSSLDNDTIMNNSLTRLAQLIGVEHGSIMLLDRETDQLINSAVLGRHGNVGSVRFPLGKGIVGKVAQNRKPLNVPDVTTDPNWEPPPEDDASAKRSGSMIAVPLIAHHELLGVLVLSHEQTGYFRDEHLRLLTAAANQIAIGIYNAQMYQQVEQQYWRRYEMQQLQEKAVSQSTAILQSLSDGVIVCDQNGAVITVNLAAEKILDRPIDELVTWNLGDLLRRLLGRRVSELPLEDLLAHPWDERARPRTLSTTFQLGPRTISVTLDPVISTKEELLGAVAVFRDRTREVESDRLKTEFIGTVSHELRTPMTSIKGFTQLLVMGNLGPVNETQREFLNIIQSNAERMIAIINDLLDITKIETGSVELEIRPIHVAETLSKVLLDLQTKVHERQQTLTLSLPAGLPLVRADAHRFNQILFNLVSNAVKYTPRGGSITIEAREVTAEAVPEDERDGLRPGRYIQIDVRDTGVGIAPDDVPRIWERFYRTENPLKVEAGGTGLGLSLVKPLVRLLGGRIWVESRINVGSTFSFVLPAA
ncbi:GAF domain-containing protein [Roseiflexus sp. RS-1]|uniref:GAF domain-containing protein n=1 Tax=Roseiflexus sp. (strain RS-1) TaxID=357808 RepID=UPI0000D81FE0|nr:GAF domain-containing protein [Roseiflexus sp. RS-1]ABQ90674.1 multi-sensor signal transduction histidine kinase [Roseiflexus sp. RS-1]